MNELLEHILTDASARTEDRLPSLVIAENNFETWE